MVTLMSDRNLTPTSMALASFTSICQGTADVSQMVHGQAASVTVTVLALVVASRLPLSSTARLIRFVVPRMPGLHVKLQLSRPSARRHVVPPSTETSTAPTTPPPLSVAVPVIVTDDSADRPAPLAGDGMVDVGGTTAVLAVAG